MITVYAFIPCFLVSLLTLNSDCMWILFSACLNAQL